MLEEDLKHYTLPSKSVILTVQISTLMIYQKLNGWGDEFLHLFNYILSSNLQLSDSTLLYSTIHIYIFSSYSPDNYILLMISFLSIFAPVLHVSLSTLQSLISPFSLFTFHFCFFSLLYVYTNREMIGTISAEMLKHVLESFASTARITLHVHNIHGENNHHKVRLQLNYQNLFEFFLSFVIPIFLHFVNELKQTNLL